MTKSFQEIGDDRKASGIDQYIVKLDHVAYRVKLGDRETLMAELMNALPYRLFKSFKVIHSNATTTTLKLNDTLPIIVISEGLTEDSVVEKYCQKYGSRVHHLAYEVTKNFEKLHHEKILTTILDEFGYVNKDELAVAISNKSINAKISEYTKKQDEINKLLKKVK